MAMAIVVPLAFSMDILGAGFGFGFGLAFAFVEGPAMALPADFNKPPLAAGLPEPGRLTEAAHSLQLITPPVVENGALPMDLLHVQQMRQSTWNLPKPQETDAPSITLLQA